jgi:hypothetical protein
MGWVSRAGKSYYYESRRVDGKPVKVYVGAGPAAEAAAAGVEKRRAERLDQAEKLVADGAAHAAASAPLDELCGLTDLLAGATLILGGFHRHDRGQWRRKRHDRDDQHSADQDAGPGPAEGHSGPG